MPEHKLSDPSEWVDLHGDYLFKFAVVRLRKADLAEEAVQETFLAALKGRESFRGQSTERTWLVGILKRKIVDYYRAKGREFPAEEPELLTDPGARFFNETGHWDTPPANWGADPSSELLKKEFWEVFLMCLEDLSPRLADTFSMRELDGLENEEICKVLDISPSNLWVRLYRARTLLRDCLDANWFRPAAGE